MSIFTATPARGWARTIRPGGRRSSRNFWRRAVSFAKPKTNSWQNQRQNKEPEMKAVAVMPGKPNTIHLREVPKPRLADIPNGRGVLIKILRVGVDGTDKEMNAAEYGAAP